MIVLPKECLDSIAFISHTAVGGKGIADNIRLQLWDTDLQMLAFYSTYHFTPGDDVIEEILKHLVDSDVLFVVIEPRVMTSTWVKWERQFCDSRRLRIIPIVFEYMKHILGRIPFPVDDKQWILIDHDGLWISEVYSAIDKKRGDLELRAKERHRIIIKATPDKDHYVEGETVLIKGTVSLPNSTGVATLYIRNWGPSDPPIFSHILGPINADGSGTFEIRFEIPSLHQNVTKVFAELQFGVKSEILPIQIISAVSIPTSVKDTHVASEDKADFKQKISIISRGTYQTISKAISGISIVRPELDVLAAAIKEKARIVITGEKGSGKSVLLCQLYDKLTAENKTVIFLRCDTYLGLESRDDLFGIFGKNKDLSKIIRDVTEESGEVIFIFDSLDAISRNSKAIGYFKEFLTLLWGHPNVKTLCSVRKYDYEYSPSIRTVDWGDEIQVEKLPIGDVETVLASLGRAKLPIPLIEILRNPLNLKIFAMILQNHSGSDFDQINTEIELYNAHWNEFVTKSANPSAARNLLFHISKKMAESNRIAIPYEEFGISDGLHEMLSNGILVREGDLLLFFHHAYLDYTISKYIVQHYPSIVSYLQIQEYNIFLRPTIRFAWDLLRTQDLKRYLANIEVVLNSNLRFYWKISALNSFAEVKELGSDQAERFGTILNEKVALQRYFLQACAKTANPLWLRLWGDSLFVQWSLDSNSPNGYYLVRFLSSLGDVDSYQEKIFSLIQNIVLTSRNKWLAKEAIEKTSKLHLVDKSKWYKDLSKSTDSSIRWGVLSCLSDLIHTRPKDTSEIFSNVFLFEELSNEPTLITNYGSLRLTSTRVQDNRIVRWQATELFPRLLKANPASMIESTISILESIHAKELHTQDNDIVEDASFIWFAETEFSDLHDENKLLFDVKNYLLDCSPTELRTLLPVISSTRLAVFHSLLLDSLSNHAEAFKEEIMNELERKGSFEVESLRRSARLSLRSISRYITQKEADDLLESIMVIKANVSDKEIVERLKAEFLSELPPHYLREEPRRILESVPRKQLEYKPAFSFNITSSHEIINNQGGSSPELSNEERIDKNIGVELPRNEKIRTLVSITEYLKDKHEALSIIRKDKIKKFLLSLVNDPDPKENSSENKSSSVMVGYDTIRGLTARGLLRLYYQTTDADLIPAIQKLSNDPVNTVRAEIAYDLRYLALRDYDIAKEIALKYSKDRDQRVQFFLLDIVYFIATRHVEEAAMVIENILQVSTDEDYKISENVVDLLLQLAIDLRIEKCRFLLYELIEKKQFSPDVRRNIAFVLKNRFLFSDEHQDDAIFIFNLLLDDPSEVVREGATFFLLYTIESDQNKMQNVPKLVHKIEPLLEKIANEVVREKWEPKMIETLVGFLKKFWKIIPKQTIGYLERIFKAKEFSVFQPIFVRESISILTGIFQDKLLSMDDRRKCLDILDSFAEAGWDEAVRLLNMIERQD